VSLSLKAEDFSTVYAIALGTEYDGDELRALI